ncbi:MAG TPA: hypothetical protein VLA09_07125, partial [Longimicrobiales bacterium]|nr:hypothetical protein [Longimicrobiales bacterium]
VDQGRILGYNTTSGGSQHLNLVPVFAAGTETVEFNYIAPVQAWGAYFTGVGTVPATSVHVRFDDGSAQSFQVPGDPSGGVSFFGFSNPGKIITQVKVEEDLTGDPQTTRDIFSIDDIRISFAKGGFVTGGGWIDSPAGAYKPELSLAGRASFGFVSKYKKGAQTPSGQTEFQFQTGDLNFHSSSYDWLLVTGEGDKAQFKGTGTINGEGTFKFMVWAGDDDPDTFRIRIWVEDPLGVETAVYDNAVGQPIAGGSIVIHKK